jgi:hypothetical protein
MAVDSQKYATFFFMNNRQQPPNWIDTFLRWRLPAEQFEEVQGDMQELYGQWVEEVGRAESQIGCISSMPSPFSGHYLSNKSLTIRNILIILKQILLL